jgi:hypothetical protein
MKVIDPSGMDTTHVAYNSMDNQDYQIQANLSGGEGMIVVDNHLPEVVIEADRIYPSSDYIGISISGAAFVGIGVYGELSLGYIPKDGLFLNFTYGGGFGVDISGSVNYTKGTYNGEGDPNAKVLGGVCEGWSVGALIVSGGQSKDAIYTHTNEGLETLRGSIWKTSAVGYTLGSKTLMGGHWRNSTTTQPLYIYKSKK